METPPKISDVQGKTVPVEVLPPVREAPRAGLAAGVFAGANGPEGAVPPPGRPIHALSALILVAVDSLWAIFDWLPPIWIVAIPLCFVAVFIPTFLIQKHLQQDSTGRALSFATLLAVLAAIPTPVTGTPVGLGLLAWTGLSKIFGKSAPKQTRWNNSN